VPVKAKLIGQIWLLRSS